MNRKVYIPNVFFIVIYKETRADGSVRQKHVICEKASWSFQSSFYFPIEIAEWLKKWDYWMGT